MTLRNRLAALIIVFVPVAAFGKAPAKPPSDRPIVRSLAFEGNVAISSDTLQRRVTLRPGAEYSESQLTFSAGLIQSMYRDRGFWTVDVSSEVVSISSKTVDVRFRVNEGALYHVGSIELEGRQKIGEKYIRRELGVKPGDVFNQSKIFEGHRNLYMSGYFDRIDVLYSTATARTVDVKVMFKERATQFIKGSTGYGTETKERLSIGAEDRNFFGNARKLDFKVTHSGFLTDPQKYQTTLIDLSLSEPYFLNTPFEAQTLVSREYRQREAYDSVITAWRSSLGRRFSSAITATLRYRYEGIRLNDILPGALTPPRSNISAVGPSFTYDNTNDPFLPSMGWRVLGSYDQGLTWGVGDIKFYKLQPRVGRYDTFGDVTFFESIQSGIILPNHNNDLIPITERFMLGGGNTVRGYGENELGPRDETGSPIGGESYVASNIEIRPRLYKRLYGVVFFDVGQLWGRSVGDKWPHVTVNRIDDLAYATGLGIRYQSPIGPLRLEFGYKLNPTGGTDFLHRAGIHFSVGELF
jgi:outer membrane protein insertion porin family